MTETQSYKIYCLAKTGALFEQADVTEFDEKTFNIKVVNIPQSLKHMEEYNKELFGKMVTKILTYPYDEKIIVTQTHIFPNDEFVQGIIFHRYMMRKGDYFYVLQHSDRGCRVLLYAINRINHSSISLGTSMCLPDMAEHTLLIPNELRNLSIKQLETLQIPYDNIMKLIANPIYYFI